MADIRLPKRSRRVALTGLTAAGAAAIGGCAPDGSYTDWPDPSGATAHVYMSPEECDVSEHQFDLAACEAAFAAARADDSSVAPRLESRELCEQEFGPGGCEQRTSSGPAYWTPLLAGVAIGTTSAENMASLREQRLPSRHPFGAYQSRSTGSWFHGGPSPGRMQPRQPPVFDVNPVALNRQLTAPRIFTQGEIGSQGGFGGRLDSQGRAGSSRGG
jgi:uncharacterized protein YgiB involved in biofilm formation